MNQQIEKGDILALKDGREVEVLSVKMDGNELRRFDFVDRREASAFRRTEYPSAIVRLIRKGVNRSTDPLKERPYDNPPIPVTKVEVVSDDVTVNKNKPGRPKKGN